MLIFVIYGHLAFMKFDFSGFQIYDLNWAWIML